MASLEGATFKVRLLFLVLHGMREFFSYINSGKKIS